MNKLYDLLKYIIYASFYVIVIKTSMDLYEYKRFPKLYEQNSAPWYTEALLYSAASLFVILLYVLCSGESLDARLRRGERYVYAV